MKIIVLFPANDREAFFPHLPDTRMRVAFEFEHSEPAGSMLDYLEELFYAFNEGDRSFVDGGVAPVAVAYRRAGNRSLSVGDILLVSGMAYAVERAGFRKLDEPVNLSGGFASAEQICLPRTSLKAIAASIRESAR